MPDWGALLFCLEAGCTTQGTAQIGSAALWPVLGNANKQCNFRPFLFQLLGFILDWSLYHLAVLKRVIKIVLKTCALTERCSDRSYCYFNWLNFIHSFPFCAARISALWEFSHSRMFYCSANSQGKFSGAARIFSLSFNPLWSQPLKLICSQTTIPLGSDTWNEVGSHCKAILLAL